MRITVAADVAWAVLGLGACAGGARSNPRGDASVLSGADAACDAAGWPSAAPEAAGLDPRRLADMTGAIRSGEVIASADQPLLDFFPEYADLATPERRQITIRHALTMTSGRGWDESTFPYTDITQ
jgi:hypothetical protein